MNKKMVLGKVSKGISTALNIYCFIDNLFTVADLYTVNPYRHPDYMSEYLEMVDTLVSNQEEPVEEETQEEAATEETTKEEPEDEETQEEAVTEEPEVQVQEEVQTFPKFDGTNSIFEYNKDGNLGRTEGRGKRRTEGEVKEEQEEEQKEVQKGGRKRGKKKNKKK